jgi:Flp pilus assembly protein TadD
MLRQRRWVFAAAFLAATFVSPALFATLELGIKVVEEGPKGAHTLVVRYVSPTGVANSMGIKPGDVILRLNDAKMSSLADLFEALDESSATVIWRSGTKFYRSTVRLVASVSSRGSTHPVADTRNTLDVGDDGELVAWLDAERAKLKDRTAAYYRDLEERTRQKLKDDPRDSDSLLRLAWILQADGKNDEAVATANKAAELNPGEAEPLIRLTAFLFRTDHFDAAMAAAGRAAGLCRDNQNLLTELAWALITNGKTDAAVAMARTIADRDIKDTEDLTALAYRLAETGWEDHAKAVIQKAIELAPDRSALLVDRALILSEFGKAEETTTAIREAIARNGDHPDALNRLVARLPKGELPPDSVAALRQLVLAKPGARDGYRSLAYALLLPEKSDAAMAFSHRFIESSPDDPSLPVSIALRWIDAGLPDQALVFSQEALKRNPRELQPLATLAQKWIELGRPDEAVAIARVMLKWKPGDSPRSFVLGSPSVEEIALKLLEAGKIHEGVAVARAIDEARPEDPQTAGFLARISLNLLNREEWSLAEPLLRECLRIRDAKMPDEWLTFNTRSMLGGSLLGQKKYTEAEPLLIAGYQGMRARQERIPKEAAARLTEAGQRVVRLYEDWGKPEKVLEWRSRIAADAEKAKPKD